MLSTVYFVLQYRIFILYRYTSCLIYSKNIRIPTDFCRLADKNVYGTGSVRIWKSRHKISMDIRIFFTVYLITFLNKSASWYSDRPHRRRARIVQSYSPGGSHMYTVQYMMVNLWRAHANQLNRLSCFCRAPGRDQHTHTHTHTHRSRSVRCL